MTTDQLLILCDGEFSFGSMLSSYIRFYSIDQYQPMVVTLHQQHLHPLAIQVMAEDGIDIKDSKPINLSKIKTQHYRVLVYISSDPDGVIPDSISADNVVSLSFDKPVQSTLYNEVVNAYRRIREAIKTSGIELVGQWQQVLA